jgi:TolB protein
MLKILKKLCKTMGTIKVFYCLVFFTLLQLSAAGQIFGRIYIDINSPSVRKLKIATPDFKNLNSQNERSELAAKLPGVVSHDLDLSGYFSPIDKEAYLEESYDAQTLEEIRFKNWSVIGAELLLKGSYACIGSSLEVEFRVFDVFYGRQILGKRFLGEIGRYRRLMHRISNAIIRLLTGQEGIFLTKLAFEGNASGHKEIYACDYDGYGRRQITADKNIALSPRWSPDGKRIIYNSYKDGGLMLYMRDLSSGSVRRISGRSGLNIAAAWTPDGRKIALTLSRKGDPDIYLIDLNGNIVKQLTNHWGIDVSPAFSPNGRKMAFVSNRSGSPQIYVRDLVSESEERITFEGSYNTSPVWSVQNRIAFTSMNQGSFDIGVIDPDGGGAKRLTTDSGNSEHPSWSPDGRYLVFSSNRTGAYHLYLMGANGQNQRRISSFKGDQTAPCWAR